MPSCILRVCLCFWREWKEWATVCRRICNMHNRHIASSLKQAKRDDEATTTRVCGRTPNEADKMREKIKRCRAKIKPRLSPVLRSSTMSCISTSPQTHGIAIKVACDGMCTRFVERNFSDDEVRARNSSSPRSRDSNIGTHTQTHTFKLHSVPMTKDGRETSAESNAMFHWFDRTKNRINLQR